VSKAQRGPGGSAAEQLVEQLWSSEDSAEWDTKTAGAQFFRRQFLGKNGSIGYSLFFGRIRAGASRCNANSAMNRFGGHATQSPEPDSFYFNPVYPIEKPRLGKINASKCELIYQRLLLFIGAYWLLLACFSNGFACGRGGFLRMVLWPTRVRSPPKSWADHAAVKTPSRTIDNQEDCEEGNKKVSQEIVRPCSRRIAALLQKQLRFCPRCVMSARPQQPVA
jgi:hypothetical protein